MLRPLNSENSTILPTKAQHSNSFAPQMDNRKHSSKHAKRNRNINSFDWRAVGSLCINLIFSKKHRFRIVFGLAIILIVWVVLLNKFLSGLDVGVLLGVVSVENTMSENIVMMMSEQRAEEHHNIIVESKNIHAQECKIAVITTYPPRKCGIATFSRMIIRGFWNLGTCDIHVFAITSRRSSTPTHRSNYFPEVVYEIFVDKNDLTDKQMSQTASAINIGGYSGVILNHEVGLFKTFWDPIILLKNIHTARKLTVVHTPAPFMQLWSRAVMRQLAFYSDKLVVMTHAAHMTMKRGYSLDNVEMIPHPVILMDSSHDSAEATATTAKAPARSSSSSLPPLMINRELRIQSLKNELKLNGHFVVVTNGLLHRHKGLVFMIRALPLLLEKIPNILFIIIGQEHPDHLNSVVPWLNREISKIPDGSRYVRFISRFATMAEVNQYILASEVYLTLFTGNIVFNSGTLSNAMSVGGAAIIASQFDYAQTILNQDRGIIIPHRDPVSLANAIQTLHNDPTFRRSLALRAYEFIQQFNVESVSKRFLCVMMQPQHAGQNETAKNVLCDNSDALSEAVESSSTIVSALDVPESGGSFRVSLRENIVTTSLGDSYTLAFLTSAIYNLFVDDDVMVNAHVVGGKIDHVYVEFDNDKQDSSSTKEKTTSTYHFRASDVSKPSGVKATLDRYILNVQIDENGVIQVDVHIKTMFAYPQGLLAAPYRCVFFDKSEEITKNPWDNQELVEDSSSKKAGDDDGDDGDDDDDLTDAKQLLKAAKSPCHSRYLRVYGAQRRAFDNVDLSPIVTKHDKEHQCRHRCDLAGFRCLSYSWDNHLHECRIHAGNQANVFSGAGETAMVFAAKYSTCNCGSQLGNLEQFGVQSHSKPSSKNDNDYYDITSYKTGSYGRVVVENHPIILRDNSKARYRIELDGAYFLNEGIAKVNRHLARQLTIEGGVIEQGRQQIQLRIKPIFMQSLEETHLKQPELLSTYQFIFTEFVDGATLTIRSKWPFDREPPHDESSLWVIQQPWEFGFVPTEWVGIIKQCVDELWVCSQAVMDGYVQSGVPPDMIQVIPHGIDVDHFKPSNIPYQRLRSKTRFKFLFIGGLLPRKGIDVLVQAYLAEFSAADDVSLVVNARYGDGFYRKELIEAMHDSSRAADLKRSKSTDTAQLAKLLPEVEFLDSDLTEKELIGLYTATDVLVSPFRGEGFGFTIFEAMASGTPVIVTGASGPLSFLTDKIAYLIDAKQTPCTKPPCGLGTIFNTPTPGQPYWYEPSVSDLSRTMRRVYENPEERARIASAGMKYVQEHLTWNHSGTLYKKRIQELHKRRRPIRQWNPNCLV